MMILKSYILIRCPSLRLGSNSSMDLKSIVERIEYRSEVWESVGEGGD